MVATELITGMEELVNHIRELEAKNKELQKEVSRHRLMAGHLDEENKKLKEEVENYKQMFARLPNDMDDFWWSEKNKIWRWEGDEFQSEEEESEEESDDEDLTEPESDKP
jgi:FtsZ-binding cell division protein ZapB